MTDDQSDPTQAVTGAKRLVSREKIELLLGPGTGPTKFANLSGSLMAQYRRRRSASTRMPAG